MGEADYLLTRQEVIAPAPHGHGRFGGEEEFAWVEVMGRPGFTPPFGRYLALMTVAGVVAALGVIRDYPILIVGAMAVSPDLLPGLRCVWASSAAELHWRGGRVRRCCSACSSSPASAADSRRYSMPRM